MHRQACRRTGAAIGAALLIVLGSLSIAGWLGSAAATASGTSASAGTTAPTDPAPTTWAIAASAEAAELPVAAAPSAGATEPPVATVPSADAPAPPAAAATPTAPTTKARRRRSSAPVEVTLPPHLAGPSAPVSMPPVGLSLEYSLMALDLGSGPCPAPALTSELRRLGSPPLALAGESQDLTAPFGALAGPPPSWETATLYTLPPNFWTQLHCLLSGSPDLLDAGLNMRKGAPAWAAQIAEGARSAATNGLEFSLGNEPDLYTMHNYGSLTAALPNAELAATNLYLQLGGELEQAIGAEPVIGPELARAARWRHQLPRIIATLHEQTVGVHLYPLSACTGSATIPNLLSATAAEAPRALGWVVADANSAHVPAILSESNSASCGGAEGVSDSPAAAVWAVRFVLDALKVGFREVRFHMSNGAYDPFLVRGGHVYERPLEGALEALNRWLPVGSSIQTLRGVQGLVATAVSGSPGTPQLILDNESAKHKTVLLKGIGSVRIEFFTANHTGVQTAQLGASPNGRTKLDVEPNTVMAVLP